LEVSIKDTENVYVAEKNNLFEQIKDIKMNQRIRLFVMGFLQVFFVAVNTLFIAKQKEFWVLSTSFMISIIWSFNVKKVALGSFSDKIIYSTGAALGSLLGLHLASLSIPFI
jgi:hypothetical protein